MKRILLVSGLLVGSFAFGSAKAPAGQGRACDAKTKCDAGLQCVASSTGGKSKCEIVCDKGVQCPADQRCVKDGPAMVCRSINDGLPGL